MNNLLLKNSIEMYKNTIDEMKKRGEDTSLVEAAMADIENAIETGEVNNKEFKAELRKENKALPNSLLLKNPIDIEPILSNMFIVNYDNISEWLVESVNVANNRIVVTFREVEGFSPYEYLCKKREEKKLSDTLTLGFLNKVGEVVRSDKFTNVVMDCIECGESLSYKNKDILTTRAYFTFDKREVTITNGNKITDNASTNKETNN